MTRSMARSRCRSMSTTKGNFLINIPLITLTLFLLLFPHVVVAFDDQEKSFADAYAAITDIILSEKGSTVVNIFISVIATSLTKRKCVASITYWLATIISTKKSAYDIGFATNNDVDQRIALVIVNIIKSRLYERKKCDAQAIILQKLLTIFSMVIIALRADGFCNKYMPLIKHASVTDLIEETEISAVYLLMSVDTKKTYVGLTGHKAPRAIKGRYSEHWHGKTTDRNKSDSTSLLYTFTRKMGFHHFCMIPCIFPLESIGDLAAMETYWIRRLVPQLNTAKLPHPNKPLNNRRNRPFPNTRPIRDKVPHPFVPDRPIVFTKCESKQSYGNLFKLFKSFQVQNVPKIVHAEIKMRAGTINLTQMKRLREAFGQSSIEILSTTRIENLKSQLFCDHGITNDIKYIKTTVKQLFKATLLKYQQNMTFRIVKIVPFHLHNSDLCKKLSNAAAHRHSVDRANILEHDDAASLIKMWTLLKFIRPKVRIDMATSLLTKGLKRFHINPRPRTVVMIPYRDDIRPVALRNIPQKIIASLNIAAEHKSLLASEVRNVYTRRQSMGDLMINSRRNAKAYDETTPCSCKAIQRALNLDDNECKKHIVNGHLAIRACDLPDHIDSAFKGNMKNIPKTSVDDLRDEIMTSMEAWSRQIENYVNVKNSAFTPIRFGATFKDKKQKHAHTRFNNNFISFFRKSDPETPMAIVTRARYARWMQDYEYIKSSDPEKFKKLHGTNFTTDVIKMVHVHSKSIDFNHWVNHETIYAHAAKELGTTTEYFSSPLNFNLSHDAYFSEHSIDGLFGSHGNSWNAKWKQSGVANPVYEIDEMKRTIARAIEGAERHGKTFLLTLPVWPNKDEYLHFLNHPYVQTVAMFNKGAYSFHNPYSSIRQHLTARPPTRCAPWPVAFIVVSKETIDKETIDSFNPIWEDMKVTKMTDAEIAKFDIARFGEVTDDELNAARGHKTRHSWKLVKPEKKSKTPICATFKTILELNHIDLDTEMDAAIKNLVIPREMNSIQTPSFDSQRMKSIIDLATKLKKCALVTEIDKNASTALIACHVYHRDAIRETYLDKPNYVKSEKSVDDHLRTWKQIHTNNGWKQFGAFSMNKGETKFPYGYTLPKNKDVKKQRPIVSYACHPMKPMLARVSRAIAYMLKTIKDPHWTLWRTDKFVESVKAIETDLTEENANRKVIGIAGDIKEMYTELRHDDIIKSLDWLISKYTTQTRRKYVSVPRFAKHGAHAGVSHNDSTNVTFSMDDIREIAIFDLRNALFTVGPTVYQQIIGIPMGSPISPILAILVCARSECDFINRHKLDTRQIKGVRYVDDGFFMTTYDPCIVGDEQLAENALINASKHCYHEALNVELDSNRLRIDMLESTIIRERDLSISLKYNHKNRDRLVTEGKQTFVKYQHFDSYSAKSAKRGVIISSLMRLINASSTSVNFLEAIPSVFLEWKLLCYPLPLITQTIRSVAKGSSPAGWDVDFKWERVIEIACDEWKKISFEKLSF